MRSPMEGSRVRRRLTKLGDDPVAWIAHRVSLGVRARCRHGQGNRSRQGQHRGSRGFGLHHSSPVIVSESVRVVGRAIAMLRLGLRDSPPSANAVGSGALAANARVATAAAAPEAAAVVALGVVGGPAPILSRQPRGRVGGAVLGLSAVAVPPRVQGRSAGRLRLAPPALRGRRRHAAAAPLLARAEREHHLPCGLLGAIVQVESGGQPHRISPAGAMGPMQLIPPTARALGVGDPFDRPRA